MQRILSLTGFILSRYPKLLTLALALRLILWRWKVRIRSRLNSLDIDPNKSYWVNPDRIEYALNLKTIGEYDKYRDRGKVIGGNWDLQRVPFTELGMGVYHGLEERFIHGMRWEDTQFYQRYMYLMTKGSTFWGKNKNEFEERCRHLDSLYQDIKTYGYRSQAEMALQYRDPREIEDEITVRIGHDGILLFEDGQHRLAAAKLLNIEKVPIKITARHLDWYIFTKQVRDYAKKLGGSSPGWIYHPITHPDLSDIRSVYGDKRFEIIKAHLPINQGDLLDIGANWGYFCHRFEELGFNCYAVEKDKGALHFLEKLKIAENRRFEIIRGSIFDYHEKADFDIVLALNIFHHFLKTEETYYQLIKLLKRLNMRVMFFQPPLPDDPRFKGSYHIFECNEFVEFILDNSCLNEAVRIGHTQDGRPVYRLRAM